MPDTNFITLKCIKMEKRFGLHFHLKKDGFYKAGELPIYMRITINGAYREISTKMRCDLLNGMLMPRGKSINSYLDVLQRRVARHGTAKCFTSIINAVKPKTATLTLNQ